MDGTSRWVGGVVAVLVFVALGVGFWSQARGDAGPGPSVAAPVPVAASSSEPERPPATAVPAPESSEPRAPRAPRAPPESSDSFESSGAEEAGARGPEPPPSPEPAGPAEGPWAELLPAAQVSHPGTDPDTALPWDLVGYFREGDPTGFHGGNPSGDWTNKAEIWDSLAPVLRAEVAALGEPTDDPVWPEANPNEASGQTRWSHDSTGGRGELVEVMAQYMNENGVVVERVQAALVSTEADGSGRIVARMHPFEIQKNQYSGFLEYIDYVSLTEWEWIQQQPVLP